MPKGFAWVLAFSLVSMLAGFPATSTGATPTPPVLERLAGTYRYVGDWEADRRRIEKSVAQAISNLGWLGRRIADNRLSSHRRRPSRLAIARTGDDVSITMGEYRAVAPLDGTPRAVIAPNGRDSKLSYEMTEDAILQFFSGEHAKRKSSYSLDGEGRLVMTVRMTSEKLASAIEYELVYERQD